MKTIGFIGVGELALYTIKGVRRGGYQGPILLSPRNHEKAEYLAAHHHCEVQQDNQSVVANSDYIVIATRPAHCLETLDSLEAGSCPPIGSLQVALDEADPPW